MRRGRYRPATGAEAEFQPGSRQRVLRNNLGIHRVPEMDRAEYQALVAAREASFGQVTPETRFTAALICEMHQSWLGGIYEWAGSYRTVEVAKAGFYWPPAYRVRDNMEQFAAEQLRSHTPCTPAPITPVAQRMAEVHAELLLIHPFRDGNGRLARWVADLMALQAGYPLPEYGLTGRGSQDRRVRYISAVQQGYVRNYDALRVFFEDALERRLRVVTGE
jgi:cell filamentation protein